MKLIISLSVFTLALGLVAAQAEDPKKETATAAGKNTGQ
jgi:hypothetical protein